MSSLVLDLQASALDSNRRVGDLLRTVVAVASKLHIPDFQEWANHELRGYLDSNSVPPYRKVRGLLRAHNPYHGWIPVILEDSELQERLSICPITQALPELEDLHQSDRPEGTLQVPLHPETLLKLFGNTREFSLGIIPTLLLDRSTVFGIIDAVRNVVLSWSLHLEQNGILGAGMTFSADEIAKAKTLPFSIDR